VKTGNLPPTGESRFVVGFDLGTTNSAVAYVNTSETPWRIRTFPIPQLVAPGQVEARDTLPSFHYQPAEGELAPGALRCPWHRSDPSQAVGFFARDHGAMTPGRQIASAKSWLCHSGVDRTSALLPWHGADDVARLSPVEVSACYLSHVRAAWDARFPREPLAQQDFVLTLPASFDEVARELTVRAAAAAGLPRVVLIEEPQAAFYAWIDAHADDWQERVSPGQKILVCDIGGGTSDFTLIRVRRGEGGRVRFHRVAVGDHLILGGDNLDLALAHHVERKIGKLDPLGWSVLVRACRAAKETLLCRDAPEQFTLHLPGRGARLLGGGVQVELSRKEIGEVLVEGFFPWVGLDEKPAGRSSGFQEFGLPYAPDAAITRYLAAFLTAHRHDEEPSQTLDYDPARPALVLLNGGVFESPVLRERILESLRRWFSAEPIVLDNDRLDLAVARGAAYYGMVRRGQGERITAGLARTYYLGVEAANTSNAPGPQSGGVSASPSPPSSPPSALAVCLLPAGIEPGQDVVLEQPRFDLRVSEPAEFPLYVSSTRLTDRPGALVPIDRERLTPLPPIRTVLRTRKSKSEQGAGVVSGNLHARLTEIGTLDIWLSELGGRRTWRLQFDVRSTTQTDLSAHQPQAESEGFLDETAWQSCRALVENTFGPDGADKPEGLVKRLSAALGASRNQWPSSLCRRMWEALMEFEPGRRRSPTHEARWLNLLGFSLRPGYGLAVDDWRVAQTWATLQGKLAHGAANVRVEGWILWRRIGGGLAAGQQQALADPLLGPIRGLHRQLTTGRGGGDFSFPIAETTEMWRLLGSLELLPPAMKVELGAMLLAMLPKRKMAPARSAMLWAVGRLGARAPLYGPLSAIVPSATAAEWLQTLMAMRFEEPERLLAAMQLARKTDDRYRDVPDKLRIETADWLESSGASRHFVQLVRDGGALDDEEQGLVFGETLPRGLRIA